MTPGPDDHNRLGLSHDMPCQFCGHAVHHFLACSDTCDCVRGEITGVDTALGRPS